MRYLAVDLGATSVRVCAVTIDDSSTPRVELIHRAPHRPVRDADGGLRWDWPTIVDSVETGLLRALDTAPADGIGVDTWGVDYGLLDANGRLLSPPWSYRSDRARGWREVAERIGADRLYATAGIQLMEINTIFQLAVHDRAELDRAEQLLMLPELVIHHLTGSALGEVSSAGTTGLLDARSRDWSDDLLAAIDVDRRLLPRLSPVGTLAGEWHGVPVRLVAGHDTASAVVGLPVATRNRSAFVCTGSWLLVGVRLDRPDLSADAQRANFSNEPDPGGGVRLLKNLPGLVILERLRDLWSASSVADLVASAVVDHRSGRTLDVADPALLGHQPEAAIRDGAGLAAAAGRGEVVGAVLDGLASRVAEVVGELADLVGGPIEELRVVGGGVHIPLLLDLLGSATGLPVVVGSSEATSLGNALVQHRCHNAND